MNYKMMVQKCQVVIKVSKLLLFIYNFSWMCSNTGTVTHCILSNTEHYFPRLPVGLSCSCSQRYVYSDILHSLPFPPSFLHCSLIFPYPQGPLLEEPKLKQVIISLETTLWYSPYVNLNFILV